MPHSQPNASQQTVCKFHLDPQYHLFHWESTILCDSTLWITTYFRAYPMLEQYGKFDMVKPHRTKDEQPVNALNRRKEISHDLIGKHNHLQTLLRLRQPSQPRDFDWVVGCFCGISIHQYLFVLPCEGNCWFDCANKSIIGPGIDMTSVADCYSQILLYDDQHGLVITSIIKYGMKLLIHY